MFADTHHLCPVVSFSSSEDSNKRPRGTPGTPGSRDLEAALRRLSLRRDNYLSEKRFFEEERERKLAYLAKEEEKGCRGSSGSPGSPAESLLSLCSHPSLGSIWSGYAFTARSYLPEKLQIVKPLEGDYPPQRRTSSRPQRENDQSPRQNPSQRNPNPIFPASQTSEIPPQNQSQAGQYGNQCLIFHRHGPAKICLAASQSPRETLQRSSSDAAADRRLESAALLLLQTHSASLLV